MENLTNRFKQHITSLFIIFTYSKAAFCFSFAEQERFREFERIGRLSTGEVALLRACSIYEWPV